MSAARIRWFHRYLRAKARALGVSRLAWYDLLAPVGESTTVWTFDQAAAFIVAQFGTYSAPLGAFAARAFRERWVDAQLRAGRPDGAFCLALRDDESRILMNYTPSFHGVSTLAHELGHGYHNLQLARRTMLQRSTPLTLAETASIFCETLVWQSALQHAGPREQLAILVASLQSACSMRAPHERCARRTTRPTHRGAMMPASAGHGVDGPQGNAGAVAARASAIASSAESACPAAHTAAKRSSPSAWRAAATVSS